MVDIKIGEITKERDRIVDEKTAALISTKSISTLQSDRFHKRGIPFLKIGRLCRYKVGDILDYLESNRVQTKD